MRCQRLPRVGIDEKVVECDKIAGCWFGDPTKQGRRKVSDKVKIEIYQSGERWSTNPLQLRE